ncbi:MAG: DNA-directed RNA polymerase subunit omega [Candidatus Omnitrophota bacterium]|nr:MAG: DNA-directed RNA polymerase subunit omega [Candidatus Omnitrophota bacterium]
MSYVPVQDLLSKTNSIYKLVALASRRAAQLNAGAPKLVESDSEKISSVALKEIAEGKVKLETAKK